MRARIYQPARSAMQSGSAKTNHWVLEYAPDAPKRRDPLMGWSGSRGTSGQLKLSFASKEEAIQYAEENGITYEVIEVLSRARKPIIRPQGYAENFAPNRRMPWTH